MHISTWLEQTGKPLAQAAAELGVYHLTLRKLVKGHGYARADTAAKIEQGTGGAVTAAEVMKPAVIPPSAPVPPPVVAGPAAPATAKRTYKQPARRVPPNGANAPIALGAPIVSSVAFTPGSVVPVPVASVPYTEAATQSFGPDECPACGATLQRRHYYELAAPAAAPRGRAANAVQRAQNGSR
jgi:hypothetical protein